MLRSGFMLQLDPLPTWLVKKICDLMTPFITLLTVYTVYIESVLDLLLRK